MHDSMQYDPIQDQCQGHECLKATQEESTISPAQTNFHAICPSCCNLPNLSWLGIGSKYAGLHTQWLGL